MSRLPRVTGHLAAASPRNGLPEAPGYVYRGTKRTTPEEIAEEAARSRAGRVKAARRGRRKGGTA